MARRTGSPDPTFGFMTATQAATVRSLAQQEFARAGMEVVIEDGHLRGANGSEIGFHNLMTACHHAPGGPRDWPELVAEHVRVVVATASRPHPLATTTTDEALSRTYLRVVGAPLPPTLLPQVDYARSITPHLVEVLVLDTTDTLVTLTDADLDGLGGLDAARTAGLENLIRRPIDAVENIGVGDGIDIVGIRGGTHTASKLLVLPDLLRKIKMAEEHPNGFLVGLPFRNYVLLHPLNDHRAVAATQRLAGLTRMAHDNEAGPVSTAVLWWRPDEVRTVAWTDEAGRPVLAADQEFAELLAGLSVT